MVVPKIAQINTIWSLLKFMLGITVDLTTDSQSSPTSNADNTYEKRIKASHLRYFAYFWYVIKICNNNETTVKNANKIPKLTDGNRSSVACAIAPKFAPTLKVLARKSKTVNRRYLMYRLYSSALEMRMKGVDFRSDIAYSSACL